MAGVSGPATPSLTPVPPTGEGYASVKSKNEFGMRPTQEESRLLKYLLSNYNKQVRPVYDHRGNVTVHVGITLTQIFDMVS